VIGAATSWNFRGGAANPSRRTSRQRLTPIENWLEVEAGLSPYFGALLYDFAGVVSIVAR
jgi:hypothetical protein